MDSALEVLQNFPVRYHDVSWSSKSRHLECVNSALISRIAIEFIGVVRDQA